MANAGGAWDNAKKIVEVDLRAKGTELHAASVVGDTSATLQGHLLGGHEPGHQVHTLFGLLATQIAVEMHIKGQNGLRYGIAIALFAVALIFVYRSFYSMRIPDDEGVQLKKGSAKGAEATNKA